MGNIKHAGYELVTLVDRLNFDAHGNRDTVTPTLVPTVLKAVLGSKANTGKIAKHFDILESVIKDTTTVHLVDALVAGETEHPTEFNSVRSISPAVIAELAKDNGIAADAGLDLAVTIKESPNWEPLKATFKWMRKDKDYLTIRQDFFDRVKDQLRSWALRDTPLGLRLHGYLGKHMGNGDLRDLTLFMGRQGDALYDSIKFAGNYDPQTQTYPYIDKLNDFMDLLHRGLVDNYGLMTKAKQPSASVVKRF